MRLPCSLLVLLALIGSSCAGPGGGPGSSGPVDLIVKAVEVGDPIPMPDGNQFALPLLITVRNRASGFIKPAQSFDITALVRRVEDPQNPLPGTALSANLVFDRPVNAVPATFPSPKKFSINGPINGKTDVLVSRTAYVTALEQNTTYELEVSWTGATAGPAASARSTRRSRPTTRRRSRSRFPD